MKHLSYKAIARMAGYRVGSEWRKTHPVDDFLMVLKYKWHDIDDGIDSCVSCWYDSEQEAYKGCCYVNGLIDEDE